MSKKQSKKLRSQKSKYVPSECAREGEKLRRRNKIASGKLKVTNLDPQMGELT